MLPRDGKAVSPNFRGKEDVVFKISNVGIAAETLDRDDTARINDVTTFVC